MTFDDERDKRALLEVLNTTTIQGKDAQYVAGLLNRIQNGQVGEVPKLVDDPKEPSDTDGQENKTSSSV